MLLEEHCIPRKPTTREKHLRTFETLETWTRECELVPYAPASEEVEDYVRKRITEGCGISVGEDVSGRRMMASASNPNDSLP